MDVDTDNSIPPVPLQNFLDPVPAKDYIYSRSSLCHSSEEGDKESQEPNPTKGNKDGGGAGVVSIERDPLVLKRQIGLTSAIAIVVGSIIGSGIFVSPKGVTAGAGSVGLSLILWTIGGFITMLGALCYAELATLLPQSGGAYIYLLRAFGGGPAFVLSWTTGVFFKPSALAILSLTSAQYILAPLYADWCGEPPEHHTKMIAVAIILLLMAANIYSVNLAARIQITFTVAKILALFIVIIGGIVMLAQGYSTNLDIDKSFQGTNPNIGQVVTGIYSAMWAYDGWDNLTTVAEEIVKPEKNILRTFVIGIPFLTILYILTNISYFSVMNVDELLASPAVGVTWARMVIPSVAWIIPLSVAVSTFGTANGSMFSAARLYFSAGREGHMVDILQMVNVKRYTPMPAVIFDAGLALIYIFVGGIQSLIETMQFAAWIFTGAAMVGLIVLRSTMKDRPRVFKVPLIFPVIVVLFSLVLTLVPLVSDPKLGYLAAASVILSGLLLYFPFVYYKKQLPCMERLTAWLQLLLQVSPTQSKTD